MTDNSTLAQFNAISCFANSISDEFGGKLAPVKLYAHLLSKTALGHHKAINKHVDAFKDFCIANRDAIYENEVGRIAGDNHRIVYSERVYIDVRELLCMADESTKSVIWKHLVWLSALMDPSGRAKDLLQKLGGDAG